MWFNNAMNIMVHLFATFKVIAGQKQFEISLPDEATVLQAIHMIVKQVPVLKAHWLNETGELQAHVHVFLNGREVPTLPQGWKTILQSEDSLDFIPPVAGG
jgi:molybdopterin synthase sulfur carrier subunit